jgi:sporulation-control protein spo0M
MRAWLIKGLAYLLVGVLALAGGLWAWNAELGLTWSYLGVLLAGVLLFMSVKAFFKAFVEGWRSRIGERVGVEVTADKDTCYPGDAINVSVKVTGKEELDIEEGRVALVFSNHYVYQYESTDSDNNTVYRTKEVTDEVAAADERILEEKTILPGSYSGHEIAFELPTTAAPSASGEITNVEW